MTAPLLVVEGLEVRFRRSASPAVVDFDLRMPPGETFAVVGASGSGKSTACRAVLGLLPREAAVAFRRAEFEGRPLLDSRGRTRPGVLGRRIGVVFQDPRGSLTPHLTVRSHFRGVLRAQRGARASEADAVGRRLLEELRVSDVERRMDAFPHELSGGLCQRVALALALAGDPALLVADEPTTALDPTVQFALLRLIRRAVRERDLACLLVTHDMGVVAGLADRVAVVDGGRIVETGPVESVLADPASEAGRRLAAAAVRASSAAGA
ncbi:MAG TPA: ABC transporter ATP-binding protein [Planctomycetota bacterium]|nr:ABC transporter ATP-binding protein [Planctomycetota bacterium]